MRMARPGNARSKPRLSWPRVTKTATLISPIASTSCEMTMAAISRRWMEILGILGPQHVPLPTKRMDQLGLAVVFELSSQAGDVHLNDVTEALPVEVIQVLEQFSLRHNCTRTVRQIFEHTVLHCRQRDQFASAAHAKIGSIDFDVADCKNCGALPLATPYQRFGSR